jgi:pimeloyl-ACP methyl ester carboxylesterase
VHHRVTIVLACLFGCLAVAHASTRLQPTPTWQTLPPTPVLPPPAQAGYVQHDGARLYYAQFGAGTPVLLLHGGLANSNYWGHLVRDLVAAHHAVTVIDSRGHGRSSRSAKPFRYGLLADDVLAVLDALKLQKVDLVGWSDGGIVGLDLAIRHPARLRRLAIYGANSDPSGALPDVEKNPVFAAYIERAGAEYAALSPTPKEFEAFVAQIQKMWATEPQYTAADLANIRTPTLVFDGAHEEAISAAHTRYLAHAIPEAKLELLAGASHFGALQQSVEFDRVVLAFLDAP